MEVTKKERLQALEEQKLEEETRNNEALLQVYKSQTETLEMTVKYQSDYIESLNKQLTEKDGKVKEQQ